ncbi:MAG: alkaline phosphatase family protein [Saprospiraceae bacterium]|nr:alkaline phosphatase family protein [Saprospiraceae bacterium]
MKKVALLNIVGLSERHLGPHTPFLTDWCSKYPSSLVDPMLPGVTCAVQSTYLTGKTPADHGIVANGWYFRDECEVKLWRQSNKLVQAKSIWDEAREIDPAFTVANMFWWYNMYSSADYSVTPRPQYRANGVKVPDCYSHPASLRDRLQEELGTFPLFNFWGPNADIRSTRWIAMASRLVYDWHRPDLLLVYLPHLDYCLQKFGPEDARISGHLRQLDSVVKDLIQYLESENVKVNIISEYGIVPVNNPIHINRILRQEGLVRVRMENGLELLDAGQSAAFAMADHQIAHIYINDASKMAMVAEILERVPGIAYVLDHTTKKDYSLDHPRSGELVAIANPESWFTYYYWYDDKKAPDFARTVDIHRKPGYDPVEMFLDPGKKLILPRIAWKLLKKKLGFRTLLDVIPLDAGLIRGSHGQLNVTDEFKPVFIGPGNAGRKLSPTDIYQIILNQLFE